MVENIVKNLNLNSKKSKKSKIKIIKNYEKLKKNVGSSIQKKSKNGENFNFK